MDKNKISIADLMEESPSPISAEAWDKKMFNEGLHDPNRASYWFPRVKNAGFFVPDTCIIPIEFEDFVWLISDHYEPDEIQAFSRKMKEKILTSGFDTNRKMFVKTGNFSNKFVFNFPELTDINDVGEHFLNVLYGGMVCGCPTSPELVIREFIETSVERPCIYCGMKLNSEFRMFYDFSSKKLLKTYNYWDPRSLSGNLYDPHDEAAYAAIQDTLVSEFERLTPQLEAYAAPLLEAVDLDGIWSVDFMWTGEKFYLIDMAIGLQSAYYDWLLKDCTHMDIAEEEK